MGDVAFDPNDILRQIDSVSLSQRSLFAECQRQKNRLIQLIHWYDHQQSARDSELRRQSEQVSKQTRQQINTRSKVVIKERARLKHLLDYDDDGNDDKIHMVSSRSTKSLFELRDHSEQRKRKIYGCLLPQLRAPLTKSADNWPPMKSNSTLDQSDFKKYTEKQRYSIKKSIDTSIEQRKRMNTIIDKCLYEFGECEGMGYDHFLQTCKPIRTTQILAQQIINEKKPK